MWVYIAHGQIKEQILKITYFFKHISISTIIQGACEIATLMDFLK